MLARRARARKGCRLRELLQPLSFWAAAELNHRRTHRQSAELDQLPQEDVRAIAPPIQEFAQVVQAGQSLGAQTRVPFTLATQLSMRALERVLLSPLLAPLLALSVRAPIAPTGRVVIVERRASLAAGFLRGGVQFPPALSRFAFHFDAIC